MKWELKIARGFDPKTQYAVGLFAAQLDDQLKRLKKAVEGLTVRQLEWQLRPGMNTIGMLLVHNALAEVWWVAIATKGIASEPEARKLLKRILGVEDDGFPLAPNGRHPSFLRGFTAERYLSMLDKGRRAVKREMKTWKDKDLDKLYSLRKDKASRTVTLYHILEHFCGHFGQILMLKHMMCDAGILKQPRKK